MRDTHFHAGARFVIIDIADETVAAIAAIALLQGGFIPVEPASELDVSDLLLSLPPGSLVAVTFDASARPADEQGDSAPSDRNSWLSSPEPGRPPTLRLRARAHEPNEPASVRPLPNFADMLQQLQMPMAS